MPRSGLHEVVNYYFFFYFSSCGNVSFVFKTCNDHLLFLEVFQGSSIVDPVKHCQSMRNKTTI